MLPSLVCCQLIRKDRSGTYSRLNNPEIQRIVEQTRALHESMLIKARAMLDRQPLSTRTALAVEAVQILKNYGQHGSQARLSESIMKFLNQGNSIQLSRPNSTKCSSDSNKRTADQYDEVARSIKRGTFDKLGENGDLARGRSRTPSGGSDTAISSLQPGPMTATAMSFDSLRLNSTDNGVARRGPLSACLAHTSPDAIFHNPSIRVTAPIPHAAPHQPNPSIISPSVSDVCTPRSSKSDLYSIDLDSESNALLQYIPFNPIQLTITWPRSSTSAPPPGYIDSLNRLTHLYNLKAQHLLSYLTHKYTSHRHRHHEHDRELHSFKHTSTNINTNTNASQNENSNTALPHALFRLGITQFFRTRFEDSLRPRGQDPLGLTPEVRGFLSEIYDSMSMSTSTGINTNTHRRVTNNFSRQHNGGNLGVDPLNVFEKTLLARACNVSIETIDAFWTDMTRRRKGWIALKRWCEAADGQIVREAKRQGWW